SSDGSTTEDPEAPTSVGTTGETGTLDDTGSDTGGEPLPVSTPRQLAPLSGATVSSRTPLLELELDDGTAGVSIELCADRQCETILADFELEGPQGVPPMELPTGRVYWRAFGQTGDEQNETPTPTWELWVPNKASAPNDIWYDVSHDIDGDGFDDFLSPAATKIVVRGSARGLGEPYDLEALPIDAYAPLSAVGDVNGDGFADLGVPGAHDRAVAIVYGGADGPNPENATILSEDEAFLFGTSVVSVGDVNRDGYGDIAVGTTDVGIADDAFVWIFPGGPDGVSTTPLNRLHESMPDCDPSCGSFTFGQYPVGCDVNGDRRTDIIADGRYGFYVFEASATGIGTLPSILPHFYGRAPSCGDVDGDGFGDLIVGRSSNQGEHNDEIWIYFGSPQGLSVDNSSVVHTLPAPTGPVPAIVAMLGDVDGDGFDDIGTTVFETFDEYAFVIPGAPGGPVQSVSLELSRAGNFLGHGDLNADGLRDFSVGGGLPSCAQRIFAGTSEPPFPLIGGWSGLTGPCEP
ncbi:MAG: VCBS repeat-containing protein, partial [Nannocystaceae bacterium]